MILPFPPLETPPAPPLLVTGTHRPALLHRALSVVGAVSFPAGMLTAQDNVPPNLHALHQLHLLPHHVHVPDAPDQPRLNAEKVAGGVYEGVTTQVDVVPDIK